MTVWEPNGTDRYGKDVYTTPDEICVRWEWAYIGNNQPTDDKLTFEATMFPDYQVPTNSIVFPGTLNEFTNDTESPLFMVGRSQAVPDVRGCEESYRCSLSRFKQRLPTGTVVT